MEPFPDLDKRAKTVWIESSQSQPFSSAAALPRAEYASFLKALSEDESLTVVHEQDNFLTEQNEVTGDGLAWGRVRRYEKAIISPKPATSVVYEDAVGIGLMDPSSGPGTPGPKPLVSCFPVQQSVKAAAADAWVRVLGVVKYANVSFGIMQEYDGDGFVVALRGGELRPLFMLEVIMAFSDALYRQTHAMWIGARYAKFRHRFATWTVPVVSDLGPRASAFHDCLKAAFTQMGHPQVGAAVVQQLERVKDGFASASATKLLEDAKASAEAHAAALRKALEE